MGRDGQVSALALFSEELRRARSAAGLTQDQLAERVGYSPSLVAHVETGSRAPSLDFARRGDEALGTGGLLARLQPFVRSEAYPAWFRDWVEVERLVSARMDRQAILDQAGPPLRWVILDEGMLTRPVYLDNALAGQVAERAQDVARLTLLYDILKAEALSPRASADLARKAIEQWT